MSKLRKVRFDPGSEALSERGRVRVDHEGGSLSDRVAPVRIPEDSRAGFNLVEMMVTLVIIGIVVAAAVPNFTERNERYRVEGQAKELGTRIQLARQRAVAERVPYRAQIDPGDRVYYFERQEDDSTWVRSPDQVYEIEGVTDLDLTIGGSEAETIIRLETRGTVHIDDSPVEVRFVSATADTATLSVVRTGRAIVTMSNE